MQSRSSTAGGARRRHLPAVSFAVAAAAGFCLALAACGGSGASDTSSRLPSKAAEQKMVKFAKCLREHGLDAEMGQGPGGHGFNLKITGGGPAAEGSKSGGPPPQVARAMNACKQYRPQPRLEELSPAERAKQVQKTLEFARCMRSHGVDIPDPGSSGVLELSGVNPQSAAFEAAQKACQHLMGKLPVAIRAKRGPGPGGSGGGGDGSFQSAAPAGGGEK